MTGKIKYLPLALELMALFVIQTVFDSVLRTVLSCSHHTHLFPEKKHLFQKKFKTSVLFCFLF